MTLNFPKSIYTAAEATAANISPANASPSDGDTGTIGSYGFTFDDDRIAVGDGRWVLNDGSTYSLANGATYTWDLYKWKASNIPDSSTSVQTSDNPSDGEVLTYDGTLGVNVWAAPGVTVQDEGTELSTIGTTLNFTGNGVVASGTGPTKTINITDTDTTYNNATTSAAGLMSSGDKSKLDGIATGANVGVAASGGTFTGTVDFDGNVTQAAQAVSALNIDCSTGNYFTKTISGSSTFTFGSVPSSGTAYSFVLELTHSVGSADVTWPTSVKWPSDTAPTFTSGKTSLFVFVTDDGGSRWRGASLVDYTT